MVSYGGATQEQLIRAVELLVKQYGKASEKLKKIDKIARTTWQNDAYRWNKVIEILEEK